MKKIRISLTVFLFLTAALLVALFVCTFYVNDLVDHDNDLATGLSLVFTLLLTYLPLIGGLPVALALCILGVCLLTVKRIWGTAVASLVILCVFCPFLLFTLILFADVIAPMSVGFAIVIAICGAVYLTTLGLASAQVAVLRRERKAACEEV